MTNTGLRPELREVIPENYLTATTRPDYAFTLSGVRKFFVEAKKPSVNIIQDSKSVFQARSYGWSAGHPIVVLTNFDFLMIYDTSIPPAASDSVQVGLLRLYRFTEYVEKWDEIYTLLSRETVYSGDFEKIIDPFSNTGPQKRIDQYFLTQINNWRIQLANHLNNVHPDYSLEFVNDSIQNFINQMIFLRICEDRNLPVYHRLQETLDRPNDIRDELYHIFQEADLKYNSGLFRDEYIIFDLSNDTIMDMIMSLYYPQSPYVFNVIESNLLGEIYELFLSERLAKLDGDFVGLTKKQDTLHRDVVTTPIEIVKYMVDRTLGDLCFGKTPEQILKLRIADIACGSGVFLLEAYDYLVNYVTAWYADNKPSYLIPAEHSDYLLPFTDKRNILESCIYGIDIDANAVEVAKFSLLLKLLDRETEPSLSGRNQLLPNLDENIKQGNALIEFDSSTKIPLEEMELVCPFDWVFGNSTREFDAIIGNPPYVNTEDLTNLIPSSELKAYKRIYTVAFQQYDKYYLFLERALKGLKAGGRMCYIVPNKFSKISSGQKLRELLSLNRYVVEFIDFGSAQLFKEKNKTVYSSILVAEKCEQDSFRFAEIDDLQRWWSSSRTNVGVKFPQEILSENPWVLVDDKDSANLISSLFTDTTPLGEIYDVFNGIQTSAERPVPVYWFANDEIRDESITHIVINRNGIDYRIEKEVLKLFYKPTKKIEKGMGSYDKISPNKRIIFPYDDSGHLFDESTMKSRFPGTWEYLIDNYQRLVPRQVSGNKDGRDVPHATLDTWYHYGRIQALTRFINTPKLIVGVLSRNPFYYLDLDDMLIASGGTAGYCAIASKEDSPYTLDFIQAVLCHPAIEWLCSIIGSDFDNDFYSRGTFVLERLPIKNINLADEGQLALFSTVINNSERIKQINNALSRGGEVSIRQRNTFQNEKAHLLSEIQNTISRIYKIEDMLDCIPSKGRTI